MLAFCSLRAAIARRKTGVLRNALCARLGFVAALSLAAGGALAQDHYDVAGTRIPAFVLLDGCLSEGACGGPNGSANPLFVAPATGANWGVAAAPGAFADGWSATEGTKADSAYTGAGAASFVALLKGLYGEFATIVAGQPALNADGGALSHVTNWPSTQSVNGTLASSVGDGVVTGGIASYSVNSGGSGYVAGDVGKTVSLVGGTSPSSTPAQFTIASVSGGAVTAITLANAGVYSAAPSVAAATTGGGTTGSGLVANNSMAPIAQTLFGGTAPANGWKIVNPNASGDIWASDNGVAPAANGASSYRCAAAGGACKTEPGEKPPGSPVQVLGATIGAPFVARRW
jgi:hypothetical protein